LDQCRGISVGVLLKGGDPSARQYFTKTAVYCLVGGSLAGTLAALFGDIAMDQSLRAGFQAGPIEFHEAFAMMTLGLFILHSTLRIAAFWCRYPLTGIRGGFSELPGLAGIALKLMSAYLNGELVYHFGINVGAVGK